MQFEKKNSNLRWWIIGLIIFSIIFFILGQVNERSENESRKEAHDEASETQEGQEGGSKIEEETFFGINLESPLMITLFVLVWIVLIVVLFLSERIGLTLVLIFAIIAMILDFNEISKKLGEEGILVFFVSLVASSHLAIAILSVFGLRR